jgi:eukaryotic-like serine/threonine-protein kinase
MSSPASSIGKVLGHYRIVEQIGAGGIGVVYRAHDERLRRDVAVKILAAGTLADDAARKRFHKEALTLSRLNHPNIAIVFDFDSQDGIDFLVTEYISGTTLDAKIAGIALPEKEIVSLATQFSQGLEAAHQSGIIHGDLKPSNLLITADARVKILDFGLARWMPHASELGLTVTAAETHEHMGTLAYMAPEQFRGASADIRSDIWGVGAVIYEMATGKRPFVEPTDLQLVSAILSNEPNSPRASNRQVSFGLEKIILKALEKDPSRRYQSAGALTADLQRIELGLLPAVKPAQLPLEPAGLNGKQGSHYRVLGVLGGGVGVVHKAEKLRLEATEKKKYATIIVALVAMAVTGGMGVYAFVEHEQTLRERALAEELFYSMKAIDLDIANLT